MTEYLKQPVFWLSVLVVAFVINWVWNTLLKKQGKIV